MTPDTHDQLIADLHNGFNLSVSGNQKSIDVLKALLIPNELVKSIRIFDHELGEYTTSIGYKQLKELRKR